MRLTGGLNGPWGGGGGLLWALMGALAHKWPEL